MTPFPHQQRGKRFFFYKKKKKAEGGKSSTKFSIKSRNLDAIHARKPKARVYKEK